MKGKKITYKEGNTIKSVTITASMLKIIEHNKRVEYNYTKPYANKKKLVSIRGVRSIKKLLEEGNSINDIRSMIYEEKHNLELPESYKKQVRKINREKKKHGQQGKVKLGGIYYQAITHGKKEARAQLRTAMKRAKGFALPGQVLALLDSLDDAIRDYRLNKERDLTKIEENEIMHFKALIKRNINTFPDELIQPTHDAIYDISNQPDIDLVGQLSYITLMLERNGVN